jgi:hypothetical protein
MQSKKLFRGGFIACILTSLVLLLLAALAIPLVMKKLARCGSSEACSNLGAIYSAQKIHHRKTGAYAQSPGLFDKLGWRPIGQPLYSYYCGDEVVHCHPDKCRSELPWPDPKWPIQVRPMASDKSFICVAVGNVDNDPTWDVWTINEKNEVVHLVHDGFE